MNKINPNIATNVINDVNNLGFISENKSPTNIDFNKNEDMVNLDNSKSTNNQNNIFNERIEKSLDKKINNTQIMQKGGYEDFNNITEINFNNIGEDIRNYMDENMIYKESNEKPKISKTEKLEGNSVVTTIITQTKKVYTPDKEKVQINLYSVIYNAIDDIEAALKGMLKPKYKEVIQGTAEVRQVFKITNSGMVAGCYVVEGKIVRNSGVRVLRDNVVIHEGKLFSLKRMKDDAREVAEGYECGVQVEDYNDIKVGDKIESFIMEEIKQ